VRLYGNTFRTPHDRNRRLISRTRERQENKREQERARESKREQERARESKREQERARESKREQERTREPERQNPNPTTPHNKWTRFDWGRASKTKTEEKHH